MNDMTAGPQLRLVLEKTFRTHDGVDLFYRHWCQCGNAQIR